MDTRDLAKAYAATNDKDHVPGAVVRELSQYIIDHPEHELTKAEATMAITVIWEKIEQTRKDTGGEAPKAIWNLLYKLEALSASIKE